MKEIILSFLLEKTESDNRYLGGDSEAIVVFKNSEDRQIEAFLEEIAGELTKEIKQHISN